MKTNPLHEIQKLGQSIWYDNIRRGMILNGDLQKMIDALEITGITSNPTIFEKAIAGSNDYDSGLQKLLQSGGDIPLERIFEILAVEDIRGAADLLRPVFDRTGGADGYVSLEVSPKLAHDTAATIDEARRLFDEVDRPNVMIKVPATAAGLPAVTELIARGVNVNVTLMFSLEDVGDVADAYLAGLEKLDAAGGDLSRVASVASFFVSRIDTAVDKLLPGGSPLRGKIAVANARKAYALFRDVVAGDRFASLQKKGARIQRLLWGSTGTKNPDYSDVLYVEELIGPDTVNTVPQATLDAFRDHGRPRLSLLENPFEADDLLAELRGGGIDLDAITGEVKSAGVAAFEKSYDSLLKTLDEKCKAITVNRT